ncbi:MAG: hypothetical protein SWH61_05160 [Thermodesulfobacteriota bacterium]|nr:hypothetical protein [Thermodesulfobacteriota bacterium]
MHIAFHDRMGNADEITVSIGETISDVLIKAQIPPNSVIVLKDDEIVADSHKISKGSKYEAHLIEGYDIKAIQKQFEKLNDTKNNNPNYVLTNKHLSFNKKGGIEIEAYDCSIDEIEISVENSIVRTCDHYSLIEKGDRILIGLSGGVDSSSLAIALSILKNRLPNHEIIAVTFEDNDCKTSPTFENAKKLSSAFGIEYHIAPASLADKIFRLKTPLKKILPELMNTEFAHHAMYIDHHTTRRVLEVFSEEVGATKICLGLHATDLIAGLLNGWMTGYAVASLPKRKIGNYTYIYPLAFQQKKNLHIYHYKKTGFLARHTYPNQWEQNPLDRNFYYYLSDILQYYWPGVEYQLFTAHRWRLQLGNPQSFTQCSNCGSTLLHQPFTPIEYTECDACHVFQKLGYIDGNENV